MKKAAVIQLVAVLAVVLVVLAGTKLWQGGRSGMGAKRIVNTPTATGSANRPIPATPERPATDPSPLDADEILALATLDQTKAAEWQERICNDWNALLKTDIGLRATIAESAAVSGMSAKDPEILRAIPVREYLFHQAEKTYAGSGLDPKARRAFLFAALDKLVMDHEAGK